MIGAIQIIVYMPIYKVATPANLSIFLEALRKIAECNVIDAQMIWRYFKKWFMDETPDQSLKIEEQEYSSGGFGSYNILENTFVFVVIIVISIIIIIITCILTKVKKLRKRIKKKIRETKKKFIWNNTIRSLSLAYLKTFVAFTIATKAIETVSTVSSVISIIIGSILIIYPIWTAYFLLKNHKILGKKKIKFKYESLYSELRISKKSALVYPLIYMGRRIIFVMLAIYVSQSFF